MVWRIFYIHPKNWGRFPCWLIFFRWVETTNRYEKHGNIQTHAYKWLIFFVFFSKDTTLSSRHNPETTEKWWLDVWYCLRLSHKKRYIHIFKCTYSIAVVCLRKGSQTKIGLLSFTAWINGGPIFRSVSPASPADHDGGFQQRLDLLQEDITLEKGWRVPGYNDSLSLNHSSIQVVWKVHFFKVTGALVVPQPASMPSALISAGEFERGRDRLVHLKKWQFGRPCVLFFTLTQDFPCFFCLVKVLKC